MWSQWPVAAVPAAPPPQPAVPPPLPDAPPPPPPADNASAASTATVGGVPGAGVVAGAYMGAGAGAAQSASNPYEQYTAAQYAAMTPEQQYALQQHWQQWQTYQQEYAKWHAQYGEQYKREMAAAAAASNVAPVPVAAPVGPVVGPVPAPVAQAVAAIGPVYPPTAMGPQMPVQAGQPPPQAYYPQPVAPQTQLPGKIMAQPQMYNQPPPPPPQSYQQQQPMRHQSCPPPNQWQQPPPPGRFNQMPPMNYNQPPSSADSSMFPNLLQPPPSFMQQPPPPSSSTGSKMESPWTKGPSIKGSDKFNRNDTDQRPRWDGSTPEGGQQQQGPARSNRWQGSESNNNSNKNSQDPNKGNQFGGRRNWLNTPGNNNNSSGNRNNPFSSAPSGNYGNDDGGPFRGSNADGPATGPCNSGNFGGPAGNYGGNFGNNGPSQGSSDNFGGNFGNNNNNGNSRRGGRWEPNRTHQSGGNFGHSNPGDNNSNDNSFNRTNMQNFNQGKQQQQQQHSQQRAPDLDEASFDRLFNQWEKQFEDWKRANANHPDRDEYRRYEEEFEKQRRRIAERREQMRRRRQMQNPNQAQGSQNKPQTGPQFNDQQKQDLSPKYGYQKQQQEGASGVDRFGESYSDEDSFERSHPKFGMQKTVSKQESPGGKNLEESVYYSMDSEDDHSAQTIKAKQKEPPSARNSEDSRFSSGKLDANESPKSQKSTKNLPQSQEQIKANNPVKQNVETQKPAAAKRKPDGGVSISTPAKQTKQENILVISLDDDDDDGEVAQKQSSDHEADCANDTPMKNIFRKSDGIPGLDLVAKGAAAASETGRSNQTDKKIPSLFDVVIDKPGTSPQGHSDVNEEKEQAPVSEALPENVSNALKDPEFMNNLSALAQGLQGKIQEPQQLQPNSNDRPESANKKNNNNNNHSNNNNNNNGRSLSFAEWQRKKNHQPDAPSEQADESTGDRIGPGSGLGTAKCDGPMASESGQRGGFGPDQRPPPQGFGPNGPAFGPSGSQLMGPNFIDFGGCNGPPGGHNFGGPNFGRQGPPPGPYGPGPNGPFGRNFGPGGPNNANFNAPAPNFSERGPNFGPNFRGNGPGNCHGPGPAPFRPNFCGPNGHGPGPNFGGPGPFCGPGGSNSPAPFDRNFGSGPKNPNDSNFRPNSGPKNQNFNGPSNISNNKNHLNDNPFRRNGGPSAPTFDDGPSFGSRGKGQPNHQQKNFGQQRNKFGNSENSDNAKPWPDCSADHLGQMRPGEPGVYRPMQVFDYQNSRNTAAKVIDYGHKSADSGASRIGVDGTSPGTGHTALPEFRPGVTFDYGHASHGTPIAGQINQNASLSSNTTNNNNHNNPNKKKNKKKNKNRKRPLHEQQQQQQQPAESSTRPDIELNGQHLAVGKPDDLEDISDGEDTLMDVMRPDSLSSSPPPPPPPPMFHEHPNQVQPALSSPKAFPVNPQSATALFPSTATANQQIAEQSDVMSVPTNENHNTISVDEVLLPPGRLTRPKRICIIIRGPPGCGKSHVARLIKEKELEMGGATPRILSIDDYFIIENDYEEKCPKSGKKIPKKEILYEYDDSMEETYLQYLIKSFKKTLSANLYDFIIVDCNNNSLRSLNEFYCNAKDSNFVPYIVDMHCDLETCLGRNSHQRSEHDIRIVLDSWCPTPLHYIKLDVSSLLENVVEMEDVENMATDDNANSEEAATEQVVSAADGDAEDPNAEDEDSNSADASNNCGFLKSKWENETTQDNLARLDGTKRLMLKRKAASMADYLQLDDWEPPTTSGNGKKRVRWADIEEKRAQKKMREIGFVVGQTDWKRMMDPNAGNRALNKTKYIERVTKRR